MTAALALFCCLASSVAVPAEYGVFKSDDRGRSWAQADAGLPRASRVNAFGSLEESLLAGTDTGVFVSDDAARSWRPAAGIALTSGRIVCFAALGGRLFAGTDGAGILLSLDKGETWAVNPAFGWRKVRCLLAHRETIYAGTDVDGVLASADVGQSWVSLGRGLPPPRQVFALAVVEGRVFAGLYSGGLHAWDNRELRWLKAGTVAPLALAGISGTLIAGHNPGGLHWSDDLGASWRNGTALGDGEFAAALWEEAELPFSEAPVWELAAGDDLVFAGVSQGVYYSEDRGRTWSRARTGLPAKSPSVAFLVQRDFVLASLTLDVGQREAAGAANRSQPIEAE